MCGLVGHCNLDGGPVEPRRVAAARDRMRRRGPDHFGLWTSLHGDVALGHCRLAVLDPGPRGGQPMVDPSTGNVLVFNGEVYNFRELAAELRGHGCRFRTRCDAEVVLAAWRVWGTACLERFVGMFALAIWEPARRRLLAARDRLGVKPFFYACDGSGIRFASRLEPLARLLESVELDEAALPTYLEMGWTLGEQTLLRGVRKLPPGHWLVADDNGCRVQPYWSVTQAVAAQPDSTRPEADTLEQLDDLLRESVRLRLVSDVPLGVFLSGGVDSTLVTALAQRQTAEPVRTFTVSFGEAGYDEAAHARAVARHLGTRHVEIAARPADLAGEARELLEETDEPLADVAAVPLSLLARRARDEVKVALTGDGGDELFHGYPLHEALSRVAWLDRLPGFARRAAGSSAAALGGRRGRLLRDVVRENDFLDRYLLLRSRSRRPLAGNWAARRALEGCDPSSPWPAATRAARLDLHGYLPDELLVKTDLATMHHGLEAREPLLDHRLAEFALGLPARCQRRKRLLKALLARYVPARLWQRPKHGFNVPIGDWLRGAWRPLLERAVTEWDLPGPLGRAELRRAAAAHRSGERELGEFLWSCIALQRWHRNLRGWSAKPQSLAAGA